MPGVLAVESERHDRRREQIVAGPVTALPAGFRTGIAGREVNQAKIRINRRRLPDRCATDFPGIGASRVAIVRLRPSVGAELARCRNGPKAPLLLAGLGV